MEFEGKVWKDGKFWLIEVPSLNVMTQGKSRKDAFMMIRDATILLIECYFESEMDKDFDIKVIDYKKDSFAITSNNNKLLLAFSLRRQREESGLTVRDVAKRLESNSPNSYAQYERGEHSFSIDQYEKLTHAINPHRPNILRII